MVVVGLVDCEVAGVDGFARLSVTTTRELVVGVVGVAVVVAGVVCCAFAAAYENSTTPTNIARLESRLNVIIYLLVLELQNRPRPARSSHTHETCQLMKLFLEYQLVTVSFVFEYVRFVTRFDL